VLLGNIAAQRSGTASVLFAAIRLKRALQRSQVCGCASGVDLACIFIVTQVLKGFVQH